MAARNTGHSELVRARIRSSKYVTELHKFIMGKREMTTAQVTAALGLLKKTVPDLASIEHLGEVEMRHYIVSADPLTEDEWQRTYGGQPAEG